MRITSSEKERLQNVEIQKVPTEFNLLKSFTETIIMVLSSLNESQSYDMMRFILALNTAAGIISLKEPHHMHTIVTLRFNLVRY